MPPRLQPVVESEVKMRSRQEEIAAENIMSRANTWEVTGTERKFLTQERQQQEKVRYFQSAHQQLKYSPAQLYSEDVTSRADYYFSPEWTMRATAKRPVDLASADPSPELVAAIAKRSLELRKSRPQFLADARGLTHPEKQAPIPVAAVPSELLPIFAARVPLDGASELTSPSRVSALPSTDPIHSVAAKPSPLFDELQPPTTAQLFRNLSSAPRSAAAAAAGASASRTTAAALARAAAFGDDFDEKTATRIAQQEAAAAAAAAEADAPPSTLTKIVANPDSHSSVLSMLLRTREEVESHAAAVQRDGLRVPGPPELRRTITRIFANPKKEAEISQMEAQRRQRAYEEEKRRQQLVLDDQLQHERTLLQQELAQLDK